MQRVPWSHDRPSADQLPGFAQPAELDAHVADGAAPDAAPRSDVLVGQDGADLQPDVVHAAGEYRGWAHAQRAGGGLEARAARREPAGDGQLRPQRVHLAQGARGGCGGRSRRRARW